MAIVVKKIFSILAFILFLILLLTIILMIFCRDGSENFNGLPPDETFSDAFFNRLFFSSITISTIGYGDISPKSKKCKTIIMIFLFTIFVDYYLIFSLFFR